MPKDNSDTGPIVLGCLLYTAGSAIQYVTPAYLSELATRLDLNEAQMGSISAAENIGIGVAALLAVFWVGRIDRRLAASVAALACAGLDIVAFLSRSFEMLLVVRFLAGFLGEGILFSLSFLVLRSTRNPERSLGIALTTVVMFASLVLAAAPTLNRSSMGSGVLLPLGALPLAVIFAVKWMPHRHLPKTPQLKTGNATESIHGRWAVIALIAMALWFAAPGAFWTFAEAAAAGKHSSVQDISIALAVGNAVGLLGSSVAAWQANRWGRSWPIVGATLCLCLSVVAFQHSWHFAALAASLSGINIFWNYGAVYQMGLVVALDPTGRATAAISAPQVLGFAAGGFVSGLAIFSFGFSALTAVVSLFAVAGLLLFLPCFRADRMQAR